MLVELLVFDYFAQCLACSKFQRHREAGELLSGAYPSVLSCGNKWHEAHNATVILSCCLSGYSCTTLPHMQLALSSSMHCLWWIRVAALGSARIRYKVVQCVLS